MLNAFDRIDALAFLNGNGFYLFLLNKNHFHLFVNLYLSASLKK